MTGFGTAWTVRDTKSCFGLRNPRLDRAVLGLGEEVLQPGFASSLVVEGTGMMMAAELARHIQRQYGAVEFKKGGGLSPRQLGRIMDFIGDTEEGCPTIAGLSQLCGISERHLMRAFKDTTGFTIGAHVEQVRSARAQNLLHQDIPIKTIGARLGFSYASHFSAAFRKATGLTPSAYRRQVKF